MLCGCGCKKGCTTKRCSCFNGVDCHNVSSAGGATDDNEVELKELQNDQSVRQAYKLELVDAIDDTGTESDHEQDDDGLSPSLFEPEDDSLSHTLFPSLSHTLLSLSTLASPPSSFSLPLPPPYTHHPTGDDQLQGVTHSPFSLSSLSLLFFSPSLHTPSNNR